MKVAPLFLVPSPDKSCQERFHEIFHMVEYGNDKGFTAVWFTEHHFSNYGYSANPLMMLAEASHRAPDLRLGTAVLVLPLWHPIRMAEDVATLDILSNGRVDIGIGRGYQPGEFGVFGADLTRSREIFNEAWAIAKLAWTEDDFEYDGSVWKIPKTSVFPKPLQQPHPPVWMAATTPPSIRAAIENGYHLCTGSGALIEELEQRNAFIDSVFDSLGRSPEGIERSVNRFILCTTDEDEIQQAIDQSRWQIRVSRWLTSGKHAPGGRNESPPFAGEPDDVVWKQRLIVGSPEECLRRIQELADVGITYINGMFDFGGLSHEVAMRSYKLFADEVMPAAAGIKARTSDEAERARIAEQFVKRGDRYTGI